MKTPRLLSIRFASALALGCALLAFAPQPSAQAQVKVVTLTNDNFEKVSKFVQTVNADPAAKAAMDEMGKDQDLATAMMTGASSGDTINTKYPKAAAIFKSAGITPDDFFTTLMSLGMAAQGATDGTSDAAIAKANVEFYNANKEKIEKVMSSMH